MSIPPPCHSVKIIINQIIFTKLDSKFFKIGKILKNEDFLITHYLKYDLEFMDSDKVNLFDYHERMVWNQRKKNLPVTLVTGFLGSGKTTLLQHILSQKRNLKIAVAVNDLAQINIDSQILERKYKATIGKYFDLVEVG